MTLTLERRRSDWLSNGIAGGLLLLVLVVVGGVIVG
jgi:hypothetical protein